MGWSQSWNSEMAAYHHHSPWWNQVESPSPQLRRVTRTRPMKDSVDLPLALRKRLAPQRKQQMDSVCQGCHSQTLKGVDRAGEEWGKIDDL
mmetsp:Transcript_2346/g.5543  ORF Transcript_2346/g.5543 Transcript_2346/m.5543 type:complete len:91 (+) Transcript_2346:715-987(+)